MFEAALREVAQRIFEDAAFAFVEEFGDEPEEHLSEESALSAALDFDGEFSGSMLISAPAVLAKTMAANILGSDEDDPEAESKKGDALGELLNMVCGNLLPEIAGTAPEFRIGSPRAMSLSEARRRFESGENAKNNTILLSVDGNEVEITLQINGGISAAGAI